MSVGVLMLLLYMLCLLCAVSRMSFSSMHFHSAICTIRLIHIIIIDSPLLSYYHGVALRLFGLVTTYASKQVFIIWLGWWWYRLWARENPINSRSGMLDWICQFHLFSSRRSMYCAPLGLVILVDVISNFFTHMNKLCELLCCLSTCWSDWCGLCAMFLSSARWKFNSLLLLVVDLLQITTPRKIWKFLIVFWSFLGIYCQPRCICIWEQKGTFADMSNIYEFSY